MNADRPPDDSRQSWSQRFRERNHFLLVFRDAVLALVVLIGLSGITWALVFGVGIVAFFVGGPGWSTLFADPRLRRSRSHRRLRRDQPADRCHPHPGRGRRHSVDGVGRASAGGPGGDRKILDLGARAREPDARSAGARRPRCDRATPPAIASSRPPTRRWPGRAVTPGTGSCSGAATAAPTKYRRSARWNFCATAIAMFASCAPPPRISETRWSCACDRCRSMSWMPLCRLASAASSMRSASASPAKSACWGAGSPAGWARRFRS